MAVGARTRLLATDGHLQEARGLPCREVPCGTSRRQARDDVRFAAGGSLVGGSNLHSTLTVTAIDAEVGDWTVFDSTGQRYAAQRVRDAVDQCALTVEWTGIVGDKGLSVFGFDARSNSWKQMYVSNQVPRPSGVILRQSDPDYAGPGVRFIPVIAPAPGTTRTRVTIMPLPRSGVMQLFEDSRDDGKTWTTVFKGEHRPAQ